MGDPRIGPGEVEDCLMKHEAVALVGVIGVHDPIRGEIVKAFILPKEYADGAIPLIKRDSYESFHIKVYARATKIAKEDQKVYLQTEVKKQKIRTRAKRVRS